MKRNRTRYPSIKKDADGKHLCRGCGGTVGKGHRTWCSGDCYLKFGAIQHIKQQVYQRDGGSCQMCGQTVGMPEYDHIIPHSEGGPFTVDNLRVLCRPCHKARTALWIKARALALKLDKASLAPRIPGIPW